MKNMFFYEYDFCNQKLPKIVIGEENGKINKVQFINESAKTDFVKRETELIKSAAKQLDEYFIKKRKLFDLPLVLNGTDFQIRIWKALQTIPYGETRSYGEIAAMTGNPKASRAVGNANNRNPIQIIIPCHRVIGHDGSLTGYAAGLEIKKKLLELENRQDSD